MSIIRLVCSFFLLMNIYACGLDCRWHWKHCQAPDETTQSTACQVGINNTVCQAQLVEESFWSQSTGGSYNFYHFIPPQSWEEYLVVKIPYMNKNMVEKRTGTLEFSADGKTLLLTVSSNTCAGDSSFFKVLDASPRSLAIVRNGSTLALDLSPPEVVSAQGDYQNSVQSAFAHFAAAIANAICAPFTVQFWTDLTTGQLSYTDTTAASMTSTVAAGTSGCASVNGIKSQIKVP